MSEARCQEHARTHARTQLCPPASARSVLYRWEQQLAPGEVLVFNNRRMLHGRRSFRATAGGARHLRGCYVCIDEFANRANLQRRRAGGVDAAGEAAPHLANQDWGRGPTGLPQPH